mgnify:CR=1 FL=1
MKSIAAKFFRYVQKRSEKYGIFDLSIIIGFWAGFLASASDSIVYLYKGEWSSYLLFALSAGSGMLLGGALEKYLKLQKLKSCLWYQFLDNKNSIENAYINFAAVENGKKEIIFEGAKYTERGIRNEFYLGLGFGFLFGGMFGFFILKILVEVFIHFLGVKVLGLMSVKIPFEMASEKVFWSSYIVFFSIPYLLVTVSYFYSRRIFVSLLVYSPEEEAVQEPNIFQFIDSFVQRAIMSFMKIFLPHLRKNDLDELTFKLSRENTIELGFNPESDNIHLELEAEWDENGLPTRNYKQRYRASESVGAEISNQADIIEGSSD